MTHRAIKIGLTTLVLVVAFGGLFYTTMGEDLAYYKHVDEVAAEPAAWYGKSLQLHGFVVPDTILVNKRTLQYKFQVESNGKVMHATYTGIVPDTFKNEAEVVLKGRLSEHGFSVDPNGVMAKCPSKYEAKPGAVVPATASSE